MQFKQDDMILFNVNNKTWMCCDTIISNLQTQYLSYAYLFLFVGIYVYASLKLLNKYIYIYIYIYIY